MTDFKSHLNSRRRRKAAGKWQSILAVIVTFILISVIVLGFLRGIKLKGGFAKSIWDGSSPIAIALNTEPVSVLVFQKEPKKIAFLRVPPDISYATGDATDPVKSVNDTLKDYEGSENEFLTKYFGVKVGGYVKFSHQIKLDESQAQQIFKDFAFLTTPVSIILNGINSNIVETNLSRVDMLRLWWKVKGISIDDLDYLDLDKYAIEIIGSDGGKFKGLDRDVLRKSLSGYFEDSRVVGAHMEVEIVNASGESGMGMLASDIAEMAGYDITKVASQDSILDKTKIVVSENKGDANNLAKLFNCDIYRLQNEADTPKTTLFLGRDFAETYK